MNKRKWLWTACGTLCATLLLAFAPPGVVFSKLSFLYPSSPDVTESSSSSALIDTGTAPTADGLLAATDVPTGFYRFAVQETTGLELHFALEGNLGVTGTARVWRAIPVVSERGIAGTTVQWTYRHICDVNLVGSAQAGVGTTGHIVKSTFRWATVSVTADSTGGLSTRAVNGTTTNAAGSLFVDPICAPHILVQVRRGTASGIVPLASDWTRN